MGNTRVHELAKEVGISSKDLLDKLNSMEIPVKNHMSTIPSNDVDKVKRALGNGQKSGQINQEVAKPVSNQGEHRKEQNPGHHNNTENGNNQQGQRQNNQYKNNASANGRGHDKNMTNENNEKRYNKDNGMTNRGEQNSNRSNDSRPNNRGNDHRSNENRSSDNRSNNRGNDNRSNDNRSSDNRFNNRGNDNRSNDNRSSDNRSNNRGNDNRSGDNRSGENRSYNGDRNNGNRNNNNNGNRSNNNRPSGDNKKPYNNNNQRSNNNNNSNSNNNNQRTNNKPAPGPSRPQNYKPGESTAEQTHKRIEAAEKYADFSYNSNTKPKKDPANKAKKGGFNKNFKGKNNKRRNQEPPREFAEIKYHVVMETESINLQDLAHQLGKKSADLIMKLMGMGVMATINQEIDVDTATIIAEEFGATIEVKATKEEVLLAEVVDDPEDLVKRPPVVTIMGHVDHGKTSLLDKIRAANVTAGEAGGITQHIGAYQVEVRGEKITFLDTPGHEAFTAMRARGAQVTDVAILVVAADDGVMPQTIEAIDHAKAAEVPIIIAINKMDKPEANPDRVKQELTEHGIVGEEWGGDTIMVPVSAKTGDGINELLEMILLVAEIGELTANPKRNAQGKVVESQLDKGRGPVATLLVQTGTLRVGDFLIVGTTQGRIRAMFDYRGNALEQAGPSMPVEILGLNEVPVAGDDFMAVDNERLAKQVAETRQQQKHHEEITRFGKVTLEDLFAQIQEGEVKELNIILKADVQGSIEALRQSLEKLGNGEVRVNIIRTAVGGIRETDVMLAAASKAIIIGFNVRPDVNAKRIAEKEEVEIKTYRIIYEAIEDVKAALSGLLDPEIRVVELGQAEVRSTFKVPKVGIVAGCYVTEGKITRSAKIRIVRDSIVIHESEIASLKRFKDDAKEVATGYECGIGIAKFNDIKEGDIFEAYTFEEIKRKL